MFSRLAPGGKAIILILIAVAAYFGYNYFVDKFGAPGSESVTLSDMSLPTTSAPDGSIIAAKVTPPSSDVSSISAPVFRIECWAWNSQMGEFFANGGVETTKGSLMERRGVRVKFTRQEDVPQMRQDLVKFASAYQRDPNTQEGTQFVQIMGDGAPAFLTAVNAELRKLGPEFIAQVIGTPGRSLGEDQLMGPEEWKKDPQKARGSLIVTVVRDGDWNIVIKWAADNGIPVNPDEKTYDPDAINFLNVDSNVEAAEKFIAGNPVELELKSKGINTGVKQSVSINAASVWTPSDVTIADKKGGLATIVSTKDYRNQMPNTIIGIKKHMEDNRKQVEGMLAAIFDGSDQVKAYPEALTKAAEISKVIYNEATPAYWEKYYNGETRADKQGVTVSLGGSRVMNLADNAAYYGLAPGSTNIYAAVYNLFGGAASKMYPDLLPKIDPVDEILNLSFLKNVYAQKGTAPAPVADKVEFHADDNVTQTVGQRQWNILFATGSAAFTPAAKAQLEELSEGLLVAGGVRIIIEGHTDNVGSAAVNTQLSQSRAQSIKNFLQESSTSEFPDSRVSVRAFGPNQPIASNATAEGRARNRRVTIKLVK